MKYQLPGGLRLLVWNQDAGRGEVDSAPIGVVPEHLDAKPVRLQHRRNEVGLDAISFEDDGPALNTHSGTSLLRTAGADGAEFCAVRCPVGTNEADRAGA